MIGTMYSAQSLPKAYGSPSYSRSKGSSPGLLTQVAMVLLLVVSGGLSLMQLSSRSHARDLKLHHEALQEELTYTKNHLHHVEAQLANKEAEYTHLAQEVHQYSAHHSIQELETLRTQKRVADQTLATSQDEVKKLKEELDAAHALIDAYKHHLSDEVASHHQREETWMAVQQEWEKLEQELNADITSLRTQLNTAHVKVNDAAHHQHQHPQHVQPEVPKHDPLLDNLPPAHTQPQQHTQQATGTPVPTTVAPTPAPTPVHVGTPTQHAAPVHTTAPVQHQTQQQGHQQEHVPVPTPAAVATPPHPEEAPHAHHNDHYQHHDAHTQGSHDQGHSQQWQHTDYDPSWDPHSLYADYPGFVDETQHHADPHQDVHQDAHHDAHHDAHNTWQHHDDSHAFHADQAHHDAAGTHYDAAATQQHHQQAHDAHAQQHVPLPAGSHAADPHAQHTQHQAGHQQAHVDLHAQHQQHHQQQQHHDAHAHQQHQDPHAHQQQHVVDDLAMKLGLGGHHDEHQPEQQWHH